MKRLNSETASEMEKAKKGIDGRNVSLDEALSLYAKKVEEDQGLNDEMAVWETTLGDGIEEDDNNP